MQVYFSTKRNIEIIIAIPINEDYCFGHSETSRNVLLEELGIGW